MVDHDPVNNPDHYKGDAVMKVIEAFELDFTLGNAVKYILRAGKKTDNPIEDLEKAIWYMNRFITNKKKEQDAT